MTITRFRALPCALLAAVALAAPLAGAATAAPTSKCVVDPADPGKPCAP